MVSVKRFLPVLFLALAACAPTPPQEPSFAADTGTIFEADVPDDRLMVCQADRSFDARWTPPQAEIDRFEPVLILLLDYKLKEQRLTYDDLPSPNPSLYHRHYFGIVRGDRRFILVCGQYDREPFAHHDGGEHRFATLYDIQYRTFTQFEFGYRA